VDYFSHIQPGNKRVQDALQEHSWLVRARLRAIRERNRPTIIKELNPHSLVDNMILLMHFPHLIPADVIADVLAAFRRLMALQPKCNCHKDVRSTILSALAYHFGIWQKQNLEQPALTSDTRQTDPVIREAVWEFLRQVGRIGKILAPLMERLCPRLMAKHHA
jgi:hypothetical protein